MTVWDPDGAGPQLPRIVLGGLFHRAGTEAAAAVVAYEPVSRTWTSLGDGFPDGWVRALLAMPNGDLIAGGEFTQSGPNLVSRVARWNGTTWLPLGAGTNGMVNALAALPNGTIVATGWFSQAGGSPANSIATWNGTSWSPLGNGLVGSPGNQATGHALVIEPNGDIVVGGRFAFAGLSAANGIARWNGAAWSPIGTGTSGTVRAIERAANGDLLVGGEFATMGGTSAGNIARWDGSAWSDIGGAVWLDVRGIEARPNGTFVAVGSPTVAGGDPVQIWNGVAWIAAPGLTASGSSAFGVSCVATDASGDICVGGAFRAPGGATNLAFLDAALSWSMPHSAFDGAVRAIVRLPDGSLVVGGDFLHAAGVPANRIARFDGSSWSAMGSGMDAGVSALAVASNGDLLAAGGFAVAGGVPAGRVARWNGVSWSAVGAGPTLVPLTIASTPDGDVFIGTSGPSVQRWDGSTWSTIAPLGSPAFARQLLIWNDSLIAITPATAGIKRWTGNAWVTLSNPLGTSPSAAEIAGNGDLLIGDEWGIVHRFNGTVWSSLPALSWGSVLSLAETADGGVLAAGTFSQFAGVPIGNLARWNGSTWQPTGNGPVGPSLGIWNTSGMHSDRTWMVAGLDGSIALGGGFVSVDGVPATGFARWQPTCPASAVSYGASCAGTLSAQSPAWLGRVFTTRADQMPATALAIAVTGFAPFALPLQSVLPQSGASCNLLVAPDLLDVLLPQGGTVEPALALPASPAIVGVVFRQQVVALTLDAQAAIVGASSTNGLQVTIGTY